MGLSVFRIEFDGLAAAGDGLLQLPLILQGVAEVVVGHGAFRIEFDGLAVAGDGLVQLPLILQGAAEVVVGRERISDRVRWPCGSSRWPPPASLGPYRALPRLLWAAAHFGSSSMALR